MTDEQLMLDARRGAAGAFELLFERYRAPIWRFFRRRTPDAARAEELAQDTFVVLLEAIGRYEPRASVRAYLFAIAYNVLHADSRKAGHRRTVSLEAAADRFDDRSLGDAGPARDPDAGLWVREALTRLEHNDREILMLREYDELSYQEIAEVKQLPLNTVRSKLFRARMALKAALVGDHASERLRG